MSPSRRVGEHRPGSIRHEILIYCATGNRSTVAAKILTASGFNQIANLRYGIAAIFPWCADALAARIATALAETGKRRSSH
jgi:rhodanese-related sulfurtransferase